MSTEQCPNCLKQIPQYATRCPYCTTWFDEPIGTVPSEPDGPAAKVRFVVFLVLFVYGPIAFFAIAAGYFVEWASGGSIPFAGLLTTVSGFAYIAIFSLMDEKSSSEKKGFIERFKEGLITYTVVLIGGPIFTAGLILAVYLNWQ